MTKEEINKMTTLYNEIRELRIFASQAHETVLSINKKLLGIDDIPEKWTSKRLNYAGEIEELICAIEGINQVIKNTFSVASTILQEIEVK